MMPPITRLTSLAPRFFSNASVSRAIAICAPARLDYREQIDVLLQRGFDQLLRRLLESREDHLHPGLHARLREQLDRVDVAVEARLADRDPNPAPRASSAP